MSVNINVYVRKLRMPVSSTQRPSPVRVKNAGFHHSTQHPFPARVDNAQFPTFCAAPLYCQSQRTLISVFLCSTPSLPELRTPVSIILCSAPPPVRVENAGFHHSTQHSSARVENTSFHYSTQCPPPPHRHCHYSISLWFNFQTWYPHVAVQF